MFNYIIGISWPDQVDGSQWGKGKDSRQLSFVWKEIQRSPVQNPVWVLAEDKNLHWSTSPCRSSTAWPFVTNFLASLSNARGQGSGFNSPLVQHILTFWFCSIFVIRCLFTPWFCHTAFSTSVSNVGDQGSIPHCCNTSFGYGYVDYMWWDPRVRSSSLTLAPSLFLYANLQICKFKFHLGGCLFHIDFDYRFLLGCL